MLCNELWIIGVSYVYEEGFITNIGETISTGADFYRIRESSFFVGIFGGEFRNTHFRPAKNPIISQPHIIMSHRDLWLPSFNQFTLESKFDKNPFMQSWGIVLETLGHCDLDCLLIKSNFGGFVLVLSWICAMFEEAPWNVTYTKMAICTTDNLKTYGADTEA